MPVLPPYTKPEIERRWLVPADVALGGATDRERAIEDHYVDGTRLRLRKVTESGQEAVYKLGKKYQPEVSGSHRVVSIYLSEAEYEALAKLPARIAKKRRFSVLGGALDVYEQPRPGLRVLEVEFSSAEEAVTYVPPLGLGKEVTGEAAYTGYALAGAA